MALVNCPECGGGVSSAAPACPHCGFPRPGAAATPPSPPAGPPPSRGMSAGWIIFGVLAIGALGLGLLGWGAYRLVQRVEQSRQRSEEFVVFVDSAPRPPAAGPGELPAYADSAQRELEGGAGRPQPPDSGAYELSALDTPPRLLNRDEVVAALTRNYPPLLRDAGAGGTVQVRFRINRTGEVDPGSVEVLESSHDAFSEAAMRVAKRMRFTPGRYDGSPVAVWVAQPITFQTSGPDGGT